jgi:hypothetical protein
MPTAEISGPQRTVLSFNIKPAKLSHGDSGIPLLNGRTLPFTVSRQWIAPAGHYAERFYIVDKESREIIFEGPERLQSAWGLQGATEETTEIGDSFRLEPGTHLLVFALGGISGGEFEVTAFEVQSEGAA